MSPATRGVVKMAERRVPADTRSVDLAINQVLAAERDARAAVDACREEAGQIRNRAEEQVRSIARRAERRIKVAHGIADASVERRLERLAKAGISERATEADEEPLAVVLELLVDEMVGDPQ